MDTPTDSASSSDYLDYSTDSPTYGSYHPTSPMSPSSSHEAGAISKSPNLSPSHDTNPPPQHGNLDVPNVFYNRPHRVPEDPPWALSDPGRPWPHSPSDSGLPQSDPGPRKRPYSAPDSGLPQSGPASPKGPSESDPRPLKRPYASPDPALPQSGPASSKRPSESDPMPLRRPYALPKRPQSHPGAGPLRGAYFPSDSVHAHAPDPESPTRPYSPSDSVQSTGTYAPPDLGLPTRPWQPTGAHPPSGSGPSSPHPLSPGPLQQESENVISELFKDGRFKRRISGSRSVNAARGSGL
ncbi:hypothetical protein BGY98DRAFT_383570 [Russula aff. rugulosa BPL654]|nr:hypothetical protein BGY98DRAFT_383570 [Russula aff. rugulosa BPL654]